jgi:hypothetical protein
MSVFFSLYKGAEQQRVPLYCSRVLNQYIAASALYSICHVVGAVFG